MVCGWVLGWVGFGRVGCVVFRERSSGWVYGLGVFDCVGLGWVRVVEVRVRVGYSGRGYSGKGSGY